MLLHVYEEIFIACFVKQLLMYVYEVAVFIFISIDILFAACLHHLII